jgi:hypothetical protein
MSTNITQPHRAVRTTFLAVLLALVSATGLQAQSLDFGFRFGANFNTMNAKVDIDGAEEPDYSTTVRGQLGFLGRVGLGNMLTGLAIQPEFNLNVKGGKQAGTVVIEPSTQGGIRGQDGATAQQYRVNGNPVISPTDGMFDNDDDNRLEKDVNIRQEVLQIQIPILVRKEFLKVVKPFIQAGPAIGFNVFDQYWYDRVIIDQSHDNAEVRNGDVSARASDEEDGIATDINTAAFGLVFGGGVKFPFGLEVEARYDLGLTSVYDHDSDDVSTRLRTFSLNLGYSF